MPTAAENQQRSQMIGNAVVNGVATQAQLAALAEAIHAETPESYAALTNAEKAAIIPRFVRQLALAQIDLYADIRAKAAKVRADTVLPEVQ
jgi:hypothetical protein